MNDYIGSKIAAQKLGISERDVCRKCREGVFSGACKVGNRWKIPPDADPKLAENIASQDSPNLNELHNIPKKKRDEAVRRLGIIRDFEDFYGTLHRRERLIKREAVVLYAASHDVTRRSLWRWLARYRNEGLLGLVDSRGRGKFIGQIISPEALELFKSMYLSQRQLSAKICWQNICFINKDERKGWMIPPLHFIYRFVKSQIPLGVQVLHREGLNAYKAKCAPYVQIDPDSIEPGQVWAGDHSQFNCWIRHRNKWVRPWITAWQDMRSRLITGFHVNCSPNQSTILLAMKRGIEKYGPPDSVKIDNGRDYDSEAWNGTTKDRRKALKAGYVDEKMVAGIYAMMDVGVSFAIPYNPQAKGRMERWFDTLDGQFTKTIPTYCGKDTQRRSDDLAGILKDEKQVRAAYDLEGFAQRAGKYIEVYNNTAHTGAGMDGRSPAEVFATRQSRRVMAEGVADLLLRMLSGELTIGKNGVQFKKMWYGQFNAELLIRQGKKVRAASDPDDLRSLYIYDAATLKLITIAEQNRLVRYGSAVSEESLRFAMRQKSRASKINREYCDTRLIANTDLTELTLKAMADAAEPAPEKEKPKRLRPVRTPLAGQVAEHKRQEAVKAVKKAAGAESVDTVLDIDFSLLKPKQEKTNLGLGFFSDD